MRRHRTDDPALARFYAHLVVVTAVQLAVLVAALARGAIGGWAAGVLLVAGLGLAGHGAVTLAPRLRRSS
jgi:predicted cobalt transporter CbtA